MLGKAFRAEVKATTLMPRQIERPGAAWRAILGIILIMYLASPMACGQQLGGHPLVQANFTGITQIGSSLGDITQMTFGPDGRLYVATFTNGIKRFDYSP